MPKRVVSIGLQLAKGACGGALAWLIGLPMPFLIGGLIVTALFAIGQRKRDAKQIPFPQHLRQVFMAIIGVMIGQSFSPEFVAEFGTLWVSLLAVGVFVVVAQSAGYLLFRIVGKYDPPTALFASTPGGLVEAISLGEQAGGRVDVIAVQHFVRVVLVVVLIPLLFLFWTGETVGSSAGVSLSQAVFSWYDVVLTVGLALAGMGIGKYLRLPASVLIGPLVLSAVMQGAGVVDVVSPGWLLNLAQLVVGVGLGTGFARVSRAQLVASMGLGVLSVTLYLMLALGFAWALSGISPVPIEALVISFAPGGVTEMSLIALSLNIGPIVVAAHHVFRISCTVFLMSVALRLLRNSDTT